MMCWKIASVYLLKTSKIPKRCTRLYIRFKHDSYITNYRRKSEGNEEEGKTEEIVDRRGVITDGEPGGVQQRGRRPTSMVNHDRRCHSWGGDQQLTGDN